MSGGISRAVVAPLPTRAPAPRSAPPSLRRRVRERYLVALGLAFAFFGSVRMLSYLPTLWAIQVSGDSSQHSLWTWGIWLGSNVTMAAWLHENSGHRVNRAIGLSLCNAAMCAATMALIIFHRLA